MDVLVALVLAACVAVARAQEPMPHDDAIGVVVVLAEAGETTVLPTRRAVVIDERAVPFDALAGARVEQALYVARWRALLLLTEGRLLRWDGGEPRPLRECPVDRRLRDLVATSDRLYVVDEERSSWRRRSGFGSRSHPRARVVAATIDDGDPSWSDTPLPIGATVVLRVALGRGYVLIEDAGVSHVLCERADRAALQERLRLDRDVADRARERLPHVGTPPKRPFLEVVPFAPLTVAEVVSARGARGPGFFEFAITHVALPRSDAAAPGAARTERRSFAFAREPEVLYGIAGTLVVAEDGRVHAIGRERRVLSTTSDAAGRRVIDALALAPPPSKPLRPSRLVPRR